MKLFNVGVSRPATDGARLSAANDLVQRTLAQHGLAPQITQTGVPDISGMPSLDGMLAKFARLGGSTHSPKTQMPEGAELRRDTFTCQSGNRAHLTYIPASAAEGVTGIIMMLHGCTQTPEDFAAGTNMNALAEQHRLVIVYPAQSRGDNAQSCWNWFRRGDQRRGRGEPAILAGLAAKISKDYGVGQDRTFVAGLSAGAAMAVILGETYGDVFAAVGAHSGLPTGLATDVPSAFAAMAGSGVDPTPLTGNATAPRTIVFHGTADATVHPANGDTIARRAVAGAARESIETEISGDATGRRFIRTISSDLHGNSIAEHWRIEGQGHAWSGGHPAGSYTDPEGPDASAEMIRFFLNTTDKEL